MIKSQSELENLFFCHLKVESEDERNVKSDDSYSNNDDEIVSLLENGEALILETNDATSALSMRNGNNEENVQCILSFMVGTDSDSDSDSYYDSDKRGNDRRSGLSATNQVCHNLRDCLCQCLIKNFCTSG